MSWKRNARKNEVIRDVTAGPFEGMSLKGIFKVEDDLFTVCFGAPGADRPTEFTTRDGKATILHVWKRQD